MCGSALRERAFDRTLFDDTLKYLDKQGLLFHNGTLKDGTLVDATVLEQARSQRRDTGRTAEAQALLPAKPASK